MPYAKFVESVERRGGAFLTSETLLFWVTYLRGLGRDSVDFVRTDSGEFWLSKSYGKPQLLHCEGKQVVDFGRLDFVEGDDVVEVDSEVSSETLFTVLMLSQLLTNTEVSAKK